MAATDHMNNSAKLLVLVGEGFACVKIIGRANFNSSLDVKTLINELRQKGISWFVLDLSECSLMDSTFLGVMAGFGIKMGNGSEDCAKQGIELLNPNPRITELLETLGVLHLFHVMHGKDLPACGEVETRAPGEYSKVEVSRACLAAHQTLMALNPENAARFKDVAQFLADDIKRLGGAPK
jgi:anti-anti-sigma regulatory factor